MLKLFAVFFMVIDHIGFIFFPDIDTFRIIGRLAFPIFAYQISMGIKYTSNINRYLKRLFIFGLISVIPYYLAFNLLAPNILFTFFLSVLFCLTLERNVLIAFFILFVGFITKTEYGVYGILTVAIFYFDQPKYLFVFITICKSLISGFYTQAYSILSLYLIRYVPVRKMKKTVRINKWFFYYFYPAHLFILFIFK